MEGHAGGREDARDAAPPVGSSAWVGRAIWMVQSRKSWRKWIHDARGRAMDGHRYPPEHPRSSSWNLSMTAGLLAHGSSWTRHLPRPIRPSGILTRPLATYSCGCSRGLGQIPARTAFPFAFPKETVTPGPSRTPGPASSPVSVCPLPPSPRPAWIPPDPRPVSRRLHDSQARRPLSHPRFLPAPRPFPSSGCRRD